MPVIVRAISIRQPFVELILRGDKEYEYRSRSTNIRGRVYLYASLKASDWMPSWHQVESKPGELPTGVILGTVEITDCRWDKKEKCFAYKLDKPKRLRRPLKPKGQPTPCFWYPQL